MDEQKQLNEKILKTASRYLGVREVRGENTNPLIVQWFADAGSAWIKDDETAWCSAFACGTAKEAGAFNPQTVRAHDWLKISPAHCQHITSRTELISGDFVVLLRRENLFHVGILRSQSAKWLSVIGGNQGNSVSVSLATAARFVSGVRLYAA